ncbi:protein kinase domain-containing protein [Parafilimonas terrae]|uniref:Serine/threonine protein kinase n=1 Tax=Parafilimonas terrae TaxID=1465490 RepID=A0A1I5Y9P0_9BACT|nr:protein kinase [Parafilimonas terrae]SFQ40962.1 Serine/threonine protein kinase [Parafilimonas terrae]
MSKVFTITSGLETMGALKTGGQGSVYKGRRMGEIITAIKLLPTPIYSETADDKNFTHFQNEVQKLKKVNEQPNPNVVKLVSSGITETGNFPYIEMEFIEGPDLEELLKPPHDPVFTIKECLKVAEQLSGALAHCHRFNVKHGDIKSNNIKFNKRTGNYVLLDFGLAIMSDEDRRTSLRHAGAIEFMAPEQNEGRMLFETDVYSFGVVMFELLAGIVPFPLKDKGETSRNAVMLAHMEATPPNIFALRGKALPELWSSEKRENEMLIPEWLFAMVYRCLEKKPEERFASGMALHEFIVKNSVSFAKGEASGQVKLLQQENRKLLEENRNLQNELKQYRSGKITVTSYQNASGENVIIQKKKSSAPKAFLWILAGLFVAAIFIYAIQLNNKSNVINNNAKNVLSDSLLHITTEQQQQLNNARDLLKANNKDAALDIYQQLSQQEIAQAMFQYANLALQGKNDRLDCNEAFEMLTKASDKNYLPAKTTLGFLYAFANDENTLKQLNYYARCVFPLNVSKGADLLMQSTVQGDVTAEQWLSKLDKK